MSIPVPVPAPMSAAYRLMPQPDWAATTTVAVADGSARDPEEWAGAIFSVGSTPNWVKVLFGADPKKLYGETGTIVPLS